MPENREEPVRVLLVDDDKSDAIITKRHLDKSSFWTFEAVWQADYEAGLKEYCEGGYDVCLLDYRLGAKTGLDFLVEVADIIDRPPVILLTGQGDSEIDIRAMEAGAADYLEKAELVPDLLERTIRYVVRQRRTEAELRESQALAEALLNAPTAAAFLMDRKGKVLAANTSLFERLVREQDEILGACIYDFLPSELAQSRRKRVDEACETGKPIRFEDQRQGRFIDNSIYPIRNAEGQFDRFAVYANDVTEQRKAEEDLRLARDKLERLAALSQTRLQETIEALNLELALFDSGDQLVLCNANYKKSVPRIADILVPGIAYKAVMRGIADYYVGEEAAADADAWYAKRMAVHERGGGEFEHRFPDGQWVLVQEFRTRQGDTLIIRTNVTERKKAEEELQGHREELAHVSRLSTIGEMASTLAHEINQPLGSIKLYAEGYRNFLASGQADLGKVQEVLGKIINEARWSISVVERIRNMARKGTVSQTVMSINKVIDDALPLAEIECTRKGVPLDLNLQDDLPPVKVDSIQIQQVILNLIKNSLEAMAGLEAMRLSVSCFLQDPATVRVTVADTGPGMSDDTLEHAFDSFFTTKDQGTGMGLGICRSILEDHGGKIWIDPDPGEGCMIHFTLPARP